MRKTFRDSEVWKLIRTFLQLCLIVIAILAVIAAWNALMATT